MSEKHPCSKRIHSELRRDFGGHMCTRTGYIQENGKWWCFIHTPSRVARKTEERQAAWTAKWDAQKKRDAYVKRRAELVEQLISAVISGHDVSAFHLAEKITILDKEAQNEKV